MGKIAAFIYGLAAYIVFFLTFLYAIGFVTGLVVPKTIDTGAVVPITEALIVNILLMSLFAVQHSVMARRQFKEWWTQVVPKVGRAQHLCAVREPRAHPAVLAMASDADRGMAGHRTDDRDGDHWAFRSWVGSWC